MRKVLLTLAALAAFGIVLPVAATSSANAETVIIKKHRDHGWNRHHRDRVVVRERHPHRKIIIREGRRHHHGVGVVVR
jgi:hypothetical protein